MYTIPEDFEDSDYSPLDVQRWLKQHGVEADLLLTSNGPMFRVPSDSFESEAPHVWRVSGRCGSVRLDAKQPSEAGINLLSRIPGIRGRLRFHGPKRALHVSCLGPDAR